MTIPRAAAAAEKDCYGCVQKAKDLNTVPLFQNLSPTMQSQPIVAGYNVASAQLSQVTMLHRLNCSRKPFEKK
jgi:hypothetical protein